MQAQFSRAARAAGLPARYLYWFGHSGHRYLFTRTGQSALADFENGVAMVVSAGSVVWIGEVSALARMPDRAAARRGTAYVHLLAATPAERRAVIEDLKAEEPAEVRLAA